MSTPRTKRQFAGAAADPTQRQITSFFGLRSDGAAAADAETRQPTLPSSVQSNLLSVGMRVRKSVPEGYKTEGTSAFKLWTDNTPASARPAVRAAHKSNSRELLPFCGINKVGGLDTQPEFRQDDFEVPELDSIPELTMSQESTDSVDGSVEPSRKRFFDDEEDVDDDGRAATPGTLMAGSQGNTRVLAVPRSRNKTHFPAKAIDQENNGNDFEEAGFLVYDQDGEIEMLK